MLINGSDVIDVYYQKIGIRTVNATQTSFLINGQKFYFKGFGKHEDSVVRGRGLDLALMIKDFNLMKWMGANSFGTIANESQSQDPKSDEYFKKLVLLTKGLDENRPLSAALNQDVKMDHLAKY